MAQFHHDNNGNFHQKTCNYHRENMDMESSLCALDWERALEPRIDNQMDNQSQRWNKKKKYIYITILQLVYC